MKNQTVGIALFTHQGKAHLPKNLPILIDSPLKPKVLVVDSSSTDGTAELARQYGVEVRVIPKESFNHGTTREQARKQLNTDIVVMLSQDAYPHSVEMVQRLIAPIQDGRAAVSYGRQLPRASATLIEELTRAFNYPDKSHLRTAADREEYGSYLNFCSNACAAYDNRALDAVGGFPETLFGEDAIAASKLLKQGYAVSYSADAQVTHSHNYTLWQELKRHYLMGRARKAFQVELHFGQRDERRGLDFFAYLFQQLAKMRPVLIPYALLQFGAKYLGFRLGRTAQAARQMLARDRNR